MRVLASLLLIVLVVLAGTGPAAASPEGQMTWAVHIWLAPTWPRVAESGLGLIPGWAFSAPYEDLKLKGK